MVRIREPEVYWEAVSSSYDLTSKTQLPKQDLNNDMSGHTTVDGGILQGSTPRWRGTGN